MELYLIKIFLPPFFSILPFQEVNDSDKVNLTEHILVVEYGEKVMSSLQIPCKGPNRKESDHLRRQQIRIDRLTKDSEMAEKICHDWPTVVPEEIVFSCLENYCNGTIWITPVVCCVCGLLECKNVEECPVSRSASSVCSIDFSLIHVKDLFIMNCGDFSYDCEIIDNAVLEKKGVKSSDEDHIILQICQDCRSALSKKVSPA